MNAVYEVVVIGGGPAGLMAAAVAAKRGMRVALLERNAQCGAKLLITGKGRCNVTNARPLAEFMQHVHGDTEIAHTALTHFPPDALLQFLREMGVACVCEKGQRYYPAQGGAHRVRDALLAFCQQQGVDIITHAHVRTVTKEEALWHVPCYNGSVVYTAPHVVIATGGKSYPRTGSTGDGYTWAEQLGIALEPPKQGLTGFVTASSFADKHFQHKVLLLRHVKITLLTPQGVVAHEVGEVEIRGHTVGGGAVLRLSNQVIDLLAQGVHCRFELNLRPGLTPQALAHRLQQLTRTRSQEPLRSVLRALLPAGVIGRVCKEACVSPHTLLVHTSPEELKRIASSIQALTVHIVTPEDWHRTVITRGGVPARALHLPSLQVKHQAGLYVCGEMLHVDADTGGYNLQLAFSTGWLVGHHIPAPTV